MKKVYKTPAMKVVAVRTGLFRHADFFDGSVFAIM